MSINRIMLGGPITKDGVELKTLDNGTSIAKFTITTFRRKKQGEQRATCDHHRMVAFGKTAENIARFFSAKQEITVSGELQYGTYDKTLSDNTIFKVNTTDVIVNEFFFMGSGDNTSQQDQRPPQQQQNPQQNSGHTNGGYPPNQPSNEDWSSGSDWASQ